MTIGADYMTEPTTQNEEGPIHSCPSCRSSVLVGDVQGPVQCPQCGEQFLPVLEQDDQSAPPSPLHVPSSDSTDELSELRIRNIANLRRGAYRSRSWLIIAAGVCVVGAAKLVQVMVVAVRSRFYRAAVGDALFMLAALIIGTFVFQKIVSLTHEIRSSRLQDPPEPPDLSGLGDGSQRWRDLENISRGSDQSMQ